VVRLILIQLLVIVLYGRIPVGGQVDPNSIVGDSLVWKNAQKYDTKNETFGTIKGITPMLYRGRERSVSWMLLSGGGETRTSVRAWS